MKLTLIGHESWSLQVDDTHVLIDPVLGRGFGSDTDRQFAIVPARNVDLQRMPAVDGIVLTTEHLQHFNPVSLRCLQADHGHLLKHKVVYVPELFPGAAEAIVRACGYEVRRIDAQTEFAIGSLSLRFYMPHTDVLFWDSRVASLHVQQGHDALFIQSDTRIADGYFADVNSGAVAWPQVMVMTNNFQGSGGQGPIGLDNLLPVPDQRYTRVSGLRLLDEIVHKPMRRLNQVPTLILAGNGYRDPLGKMHQPWSNLELAQISNELSLLRAVHSLAPGESFDVAQARPGAPVDWIGALREQAEAMPTQGRSRRVGLDAEQIKAHLDEMARTWLITRYGQVLMTQGDYLGRAIGPCRAVLQLTRENAETRQWLLDVSRVEFVEVADEGAGAIKRYPYGIRVDYEDFCRLILGELQIWELLNLSASQWYVCDRYDSPLAFWLEYYNEQVDYARALRSYEMSLATAS
ncbi:MBL fold metallo-hydrolase [Pseudomonas chlororaphis]|uniref:MBL fold metallo-hydrolase n=1 Tax=Pseudomonas chlororaphis TaxID=587753 RepID=UPI001E54CEB7|nr:MBL fold metallo-hydrolase [Pseudomonas chlororaphis]MCB2254004.1 MBL fold metallo-hydrolase [Pseudomonas chlororaphis]